MHIYVYTYVQLSKVFDMRLYTRNTRTISEKKQTALLNLYYKLIKLKTNKKAKAKAHEKHTNKHIVRTFHPVDSGTGHPIIFSRTFQCAASFLPYALSKYLYIYLSAPQP